MKMKSEIIENGYTKLKSPHLSLSLFDKFTMQNSSVGLKHVYIKYTCICVHKWLYVCIMVYIYV